MRWEDANRYAKTEADLSNSDSKVRDMTNAFQQLFVGLTSGFGGMMAEIYNLNFSCLIRQDVLFLKFLLVPSFLPPSCTRPV